MSAQITVIVPHEAKHTLQVAYDTLLSMGEISSKYPPHIDTTLLFASVKFTLLRSCLIIVESVDANKCKMNFTCDFDVVRTTGRGKVIWFMSDFLKKFSQNLFLEI